MAHGTKILFDPPQGLAYVFSQHLHYYFALIGCISFFAMDRVKLAADVWFIPVNRPATEDVALYCSLAGVALYLISFVTVTVKAFSHKE